MNVKLTKIVPKIKFVGLKFWELWASSKSVLKIPSLALKSLVANVILIVTVFIGFGKYAKSK